MQRIAVAQMCSSADLDENLAALDNLCQQAVEQKASTLILPENFAFMGVTEHDKLSIAEIVGEGVIQARLSTLAARYQLWIIAGTIPIQAPNHRVFASSLVFNAAGIQVARYDKMHLFDVVISETETYQESETIAPGENKPIVVDTPVGCIGLSVCYDVRFPALYRALLLKNAELFTVVSAFTETTGRAHWHVLLRARAIENMCYVLGSNQVGTHAGGQTTYGHSVIINPWGEIIAELEHGTGIICAEIDLEYLHQKRAAFPCIKHHIL